MKALVDPVYHEAILDRTRKALPVALATYERAWEPLSEHERDIFAVAYAIGVAQGIEEARRIMT